MSTPACWFVIGPVLLLIGGVALAAVQIGYEIARDTRRKRVAAARPPLPGAAKLA